jgi:glucose-6-phosphate isomerase
LLGAKGKVMTVMFPYSQKLIRLADWYRQLLAESIGKRVNNQGEVVHVGLTPINALGVTDQHSQSQLYNEGPNDKFFVFIEVQNHQTEVDIPNLYPGEKTVSFLNKVSFAKLLHIEKKATEQSLTKNDRPNITLSIDQINERTLGELFMLLEGSIAFLGEFYNINAFDQPGVELSKKLTKELLERR